MSAGRLAAGRINLVIRPTSQVGPLHAIELVAAPCVSGQHRPIIRTGRMGDTTPACKYDTSLPDLANEIATLHLRPSLVFKDNQYASVEKPRRIEHTPLPSDR